MIVDLFDDPITKYKALNVEAKKKLQHKTF